MFLYARALEILNCIITLFDVTAAMKKTLRERQTLRASCSKAEPKNFRPAADPFPGAQDGQNLISWSKYGLPSFWVYIWMSI